MRIAAFFVTRDSIPLQSIWLMPKTINVLRYVLQPKWHQFLPLLQGEGRGEGKERSTTKLRAAFHPAA